MTAPLQRPRGSAADRRGRPALTPFVAGARPINWVGVACEWAPDYASPERALLNDVILRYGGGVGLAAEYMMTQLAAGLVPTPAWALELATP